MNPLAGGAIPSHEKEFAFLAGPRETATQAALRFVIGCPEISVALVGFTTRAQVDEACALADCAAVVTAAVRERLRSHLGGNLNEICTGCGYCDDCPVDIPIPAYMQFYNDKVMFGKSDDDMRKALGFHHDWGLLVGRKASAEACVTCGKCESACTQHLRISKWLETVAAWESGK
jgi:predicted aldo/keto reductase-like oxidoreductase